MNISIFKRLLIILVIPFVLEGQGAPRLDGLDDLPTYEPAIVRLVKRHPYVSATTFISALCILVANMDPGFRDQIKQTAQKARIFVVRSGKEWIDWCYNC